MRSSRHTYNKPVSPFFILFFVMIFSIVLNTPETFANETSEKSTKKKVYTPPQSQLLPTKIYEDGELIDLTIGEILKATRTHQNSTPLMSNFLKKKLMLFNEYLRKENEEYEKSKNNKENTKHNTTVGPDHISPTESVFAEATSDRPALDEATSDRPALDEVTSDKPALDEVTSDQQLLEETESFLNNMNPLTSDSTNWLGAVGLLFLGLAGAASRHGSKNGADGRSSSSSVSEPPKPKITDLEEQLASLPTPRISWKF